MNDLQEELLKEHKIIIHSYTSNVTDIPLFLKQVDNITNQNKNSTIQLLNTDNICGKIHLNQAITQAIKAFHEKQNFANDKGLEICVRLSTQKQINKALKMLGIINKGNITVIYIDTKTEQIKEIELLLNKKNDQLLEEYDPLTIQKLYKISNNELKNNNLIDILNEKIALLAIKN